ncbi:hypothetical protein CXF59_08655 [Flavobacterium sp. ALD4]|nr:hypothetical protein CXF59_08655 [Flavobacterium sp. ALD4]
MTFNHESKEYAASSFLLSDKKNIYRQAKITPTKPGQSGNGIPLESLNRLLANMHLIFFYNYSEKQRAVTIIYIS